jgi:hypothetical protein
LPNRKSSNLRPTASSVIKAMGEQPAHHAVIWKYSNFLRMKNGTTK